jgi:hypothetical protein
VDIKHVFMSNASVEKSDEKKRAKEKEKFLKSATGN